MKKLITCTFFLILCVCSCERVEKVVENPQVQKDSENLVEDLLKEGEDIIEAETGVKVDVQIPKEPQK